MRLPAWLPALAAAALLIAHGTASAQTLPDKKQLEVSGEGTELFRGLLDHFGIKPLTEREYTNLRNFDDVILISLGDDRLRPGPGPGPSARLQQVMASGSVLIASDSLLSVTTPAEMQFRIAGARIICHDEEVTHRNSMTGMSEPRCPYVVPIEANVEAREERSINRLFKGLHRIATNSPSSITAQGWADDIQFPLARFPNRCISQRAILPRDAYFAAGGEGPDRSSGDSYRLLILADHSIFINQMLLEPGTHNLELTYRVIEFLQGPGKSRKRCVFFEDGKIIDHFDDLRQAYAKQNQMPLPQVNLWAMQEKLTDLGNAIIDRLQTNNAHNNLLLGSVDREGRLTVIARFLLLLATVVAGLFLVRRLWRSRKPSDIPPPPNVPAASTGPPGVFDRRQKELLRRDNVLEPVRDLVRDFFTSIGIHGEPVRMPKVVINDVVRKPDSLRSAIKDFWKIAFGPPQALSVRRWREVEPFFERLRTAHAEGKWRFVVAEFSASSASVASSAGSIA